MKKVLLLVLTTMLMACSGGVTSNKPVEFLEIPIEGSVYSFGSKLEGKGYVSDGEDAYYPTLFYNGIYLNKKTVIKVWYDKDTKEVDWVQVNFDDDLPNANAIIAEYNQKYGKCELNTDDSGCNEFTWKVNNGYIRLTTYTSPIMDIIYSSNVANDYHNK